MATETAPPHRKSLFNPVCSGQRTGHRGSPPPLPPTWGRLLPCCPAHRPPPGCGVPEGSRVWSRGWFRVWSRGSRPQPEPGGAAAASRGALEAAAAAGGSRVGAGGQSPEATPGSGAEPRGPPGTCCGAQSLRGAPAGSRRLPGCVMEGPRGQRGLPGFWGWPLRFPSPSASARKFARQANTSGEVTGTDRQHRAPAELSALGMLEISAVHARARRTLSEGPGSWVCQSLS